MRWLVLAVIGLYRKVLSPILPPTCRFSPSCSQYAYQAVDRYGVWRGAGLTLRRIFRCHPWNEGGHDPVP